MTCPDPQCECHGQTVTGRNRNEDGTLTPRTTCPVCGEGLVVAPAAAEPDWIERKTAELLARAKRSPYFRHWDVALAISVAHWCDPLPYRT